MINNKVPSGAWSFADIVKLIALKKKRKKKPWYLKRAKIKAEFIQSRKWLQPSTRRRLCTGMGLWTDHHKDRQTGRQTDRQAGRTLFHHDWADLGPFWTAPWNPPNPAVFLLSRFLWSSRSLRRLTRDQGLRAALGQLANYPWSLLTPLILLHYRRIPPQQHLWGADNSDLVTSFFRFWCRPLDSDQISCCGLNNPVTSLEPVFIHTRDWSKDHWEFH